MRATLRPLTEVLRRNAIQKCDEEIERCREELVFWQAKRQALVERES